MYAFAAGPTIAQAKAASPESLWTFLAALPSTMEAQVWYGLLLSGAVGIAAHYFYKWANDEIQGNLFNYLFRQYPKRTILSFSAYVAWTLSLVGTGIFTTSSEEFVGWSIVLILGLTNGYGVDSLANKGGRAIWDAETRAKMMLP
jgi:hypothetical protein